MNARTVLKLVFLGLLLFLSACNQYTVKKKVNSLETSITNYDVALRWAEYQHAYGYHVLRDGTRPPANLDRLRELSVTGIKVVEKIINEDHSEANVKTEISYYMKTEGTIRKIKLDQIWWFNEESQQWLIDGPFPEFK